MARRIAGYGLELARHALGATSHGARHPSWAACASSASGVRPSMSCDRPHAYLPQDTDMHMCVRGREGSRTTLHHACHMRRRIHELAHERQGRHCPNRPCFSLLHVCAHRPTHTVGNKKGKTHLQRKHPWTSCRPARGWQRGSLGTRRRPSLRARLNTCPRRTRHTWCRTWRRAFLNTYRARK